MSDPATLVGWFILYVVLIVAMVYIVMKDSSPTI